jgi:hypothetical protein
LLFLTQKEMVRRLSLKLPTANLMPSCFFLFLFVVQPPKTTTAAPAAKPAAKKTGAAPKKGPMKKTKTALQANPLFPARARSARIGGDLRVSDFSF